MWSVTRRSRGPGRVGVVLMGDLLVRSPGASPPRGRGSRGRETGPSRRSAPAPPLRSPARVVPSHSHDDGRVLAEVFRVLELAVAFAHVVCCPHGLPCTRRAIPGACPAP